MRKVIVFVIACLLFAGKAYAPCDYVRPLKVLPPVQELIAIPVERPVETIAVIETQNDQVESENDIVEFTEDDKLNINALAHMAAGEYKLCGTPEQKMQCAAVVECAMWRVMAGSRSGFADTPYGVVTQEWQFHGYSPDNYVSDELLLFVSEVYARANKVLDGSDAQEVGCVLPTNYLWFSGTGTVNIFRDQYEGGNYWNWTWGNPYEEE